MKTLGATRAHHGLNNKATIMITSQHSPSDNQPSLYAMDYNGVGAAQFVIIRILPSKLHTVTAGHTYSSRLFPWPSRHVQSYTSGLHNSCGGASGINTRCGTVGNGPNDQFHMLRACGSQHAQISPHCLVADIMRTICGNSWNHAAKPPSSALAPTTSEPIKTG